MKTSLYKDLYIRKANKEEFEYFSKMLKTNFSGYMVVTAPATYAIYSGKMRYTPYMSFRINKARNILIHACYDRFDSINLNKDGKAIDELKYSKDNFKYETE